MNRKEQMIKTLEICTRAEQLGLTNGALINHMMDIDHACEIFDIDLEAWLNADDFNFAHDFVGIYNNFNRKTCKMENCFVPRFSKEKRND